MLLFYHKIYRNSTAHPILYALIEIGNPLQNPLGGIRQSKDAEAPCKHGCGFSERDLAEQQQAMKKISAASLLVIDFPVIVPDLNFRARNGFRAGDVGFGQRNLGVNQLVTHRFIQ